MIIEYSPTSQLHNPIDTLRWDIKKEFSDLFNIRWYSINLTDSQRHHIKNRNLVNAKDREMLQLQQFLIYGHLQNILDIDINTATNDHSIQNYDTFNIRQQPWIIFTNGSQANQYAIQEISMITKKSLISNLSSHKSVLKHADVVSTDVSSQNIIQHIKRQNWWWIIATFGTTNFGDNDDRIMNTEILEYCHKKNILIHLDMAYGWYYLTEQQRSRLRANSKYIYSIMLDPHKMICDYGCSLLLYPNWRHQNNESISYFDWLGIEAGTSISPLASYQAQLFLKTYWLAGLQTIKDSCLHIAKQIGSAFEDAWHRLYIESKNMQYPNVCIKLNDKISMNRLYDLYERNNFSIAKINTDTEFGIRIFVSPTEEFFNATLMERVLQLTTQI